MSEVSPTIGSEVCTADGDRAFEPGAEVTRRAALRLRVVDVTE